MKYAFVAATLATVVSAQSPIWGQCGGNNWTGPKTCASGSSCVYNNDWYSQCIPGANPPASSTTRTTTTTTTRTTSRGGPSSTTTPIRTTSTTAGNNPPTTTSPTRTTTTSAGGSVTTPGGGVTASGNPFSGKQGFVNPYYASEILTLAVPSLPSSLRAAATAVAKVPTFAWMDTISKIEPLLEGNLALISAANKAGANPPILGQFVVYDLPDRDCAALASNGELALANNGANRYKTEYIDVIRSKLQKYSDVNVVLVIEPDSLANMITNMGVQKCANAATAHRELTIYAIKQLALPNVTMYLDGGHGGWLGWPENLAKAGVYYGSLFKDAGAPKQLRGFAVNVSNYNAWTIGTCPAYTSPNPNCDEKRYIEAFAPALAANGWPDAHFIMDTGRNGVQPTAQIKQGNWCNIIGTGFGLRPGQATGSSLLDAFVWIKPGGEADGTSDTSAVRYDATCGTADALKPAPEAGTWFQAYFEQLLRNSNPTFL